MPNSYKEYLAATILSDGNVVTYRSLSRALKIHVNYAKEMLYQFHQQQNSTTPGSVHATYLLSGVRKPLADPPLSRAENRDGEDETMRSSPFPSSSMPQQESAELKTVIMSITLAREEDLESHNEQLTLDAADARDSFEDISSIHVYSLQPRPLKDLQVLSNVNREVHQQYANEDPLEVGQQYGTIINPNVKRRTTRRPPSAAPALVASKSSTEADRAGRTAKTEAVRPSSKESRPASTEREFEQKPKANNESSQTSAQSKVVNGVTSKPSSMKREKSSLFKAFAKTKPKLKREDTDSSATASAQPSAPKDEPMKDASEDEQEEDLVLPATSRKGTDDDAERASKAKREEQLRKMMEVDDESSEASAASEPEPANDQPSMAIATAVPAPVMGGRRRGRRKIMKKKTTRDEEGYLVTKEEPTWESFSEDEPEPPSARTPASTASSGIASRPKKSGAKAGQGGIQSFFSKR